MVELYITPLFGISIAIICNNDGKIHGRYLHGIYMVLFSLIISYNGIGDDWE